MIGNIHLKQSVKGIWKKSLLLCAALFLFEMLFAVLSTSVVIQKSILRDMNDIPAVAQKMMGKGVVESMLKYGLIAVGYVHPFMLIIFILFIFIAASQMITSEIGSGTIGFTLSKPVSRKRLYLNFGIIVYLGTALLALSTYLSSLLGVLLFHSQKLPKEPFAHLAWNLFLLMIFAAGYIAVFAAVSDSGKKLFTYGGTTLFAFYILTFAAPLWKPLEYVSPVSPFSYYKPMALLIGGRIDLTTSLAIIAVSMVMFGIGAIIFNRRDISSG